MLRLSMDYIWVKSFGRLVFFICSLYTFQLFLILLFLSILNKDLCQLKSAVDSPFYAFTLNIRYITQINCLSSIFYSFGIEILYHQFTCTKSKCHLYIELRFLYIYYRPSCFLLIHMKRK